MKKNYIGISRDHSGSMYSLARYAARDYNETIDSIKKAASMHNQDTIVSVVECGSGNTNKVRSVIKNSSLAALDHLSESAYVAEGRGTPLWDSVGELIEMFERVPDKDDPDVSFMVMAITDGAENASAKWNIASLKQKIRELVNTDRWTFVFRVPKGYGWTLSNIGIPEGNILEWEQSKAGMETSTIRTTAAFDGYYSARASGMKSCSTFYADTSSLTTSIVENKLIDISSQVKLFGVSVPAEIKKFVESNLNAPMLKGAAYYQLVKPEKEVQDYKQIVIRDKKTGAVYGGANARTLLGLPHIGTVKIVPNNHGNYDIYVQSTSVNRKVYPGTFVLYYPGGLV